MGPGWRVLVADQKLDVVAIGNAIVDVLARTEEAFLSEQGLIKGSMALIDAARAELLYGLLGPAVECSGGSAGNTMAGVGPPRAQGGHIGKGAGHPPGRGFAPDIAASGGAFRTPPPQD